MRNILLRFDDICPTMNWEQWHTAKQMLDDAGVTALLGVIPDCQDPDLQICDAKPDFWEYIRGLQQQGYTIAMHGLNHIFSLKANGIVTRDKISEFAGLPYEEQFRKINMGKKILESHGLPTEIFFAPAHSYDDNTLRALSECGFKYMSDGLSSKAYCRYKITLLPCRSGGIPRMRTNGGYYTAVIHAHEWGYPEKAHEQVKFKNLINNHSREIISFNQFCSQKKGSSIIQRLDEQIYYIAVQCKNMLLKVIRR